MRYRFDECLERGKIVRISPDPDLIGKEHREAEADLQAAKNSLEDHNEKWAIIQGYYFMVHSLRSRVFAQGYREKSHRCLKYAVEALLVDPGFLEPEVLDQFSFAMTVREGADYGNVYDSGTARIIVSSAQSIYERVSRGS
ncbi:MAG: HEPN domain-containing protein [Methanoregulaceae archaeon]|mgnify:FL=1|jgi:uncharacterized protein (UPF0332 family)|nr:HEPN domain-containing protein [Methanoregulaceae archaeon]